MSDKTNDFFVWLFYGDVTGPIFAVLVYGIIWTTIAYLPVHTIDTDVLELIGGIRASKFGGILLVMLSALQLSCEFWLKCNKWAKFLMSLVVIFLVTQTALVPLILFFPSVPLIIAGNVVMLLICGIIAARSLPCIPDNG